MRFGLNDGLRGFNAHRFNWAILRRALVGGAFWLRGALLLGRTLLIGAVLARLVGTGVILERLVSAARIGAVLVDARRIGAALAFVAGIVAAIIVIALVVSALVIVALVIVALTITAIGVVALVVKALPVSALPIVALAIVALAIATLPVAPLIILRAAVIVIARRALVLPAILAPIWALLSRASFGGFDQACFFIADHFNHIMACDIGLFVATIIAVIGAVFTLAPLARLPILRPVLRIALLAAFLFGGQLAVGFGQKPCVMFGVLQKVFGGNAVVGQLRITGEKLVFFDQLGRGATHLAIGA